MTLSRRGPLISAIVLLLSVGLVLPAAGKKDLSVQADILWADYPEIFAEFPWDIGRHKVIASEPDHGKWIFENPYNDWAYLNTVDFPPEALAELGLPPDATNKEAAKKLKELIQGVNLEVDVNCVNVNVNGDRVVVAGEVSKVGDYPGFEALLGTWAAIELFDTSVYNLLDYIDWDLGLSETEAVGYCVSGDVPDGWETRIHLSGEIEVRG